MKRIPSRHASRRWSPVLVFALVVAASSTRRERPVSDDDHRPLRHRARASTPATRSKILGMPVGDGDESHPGPTYVTVSWKCPPSTPIPADASAFIMAPQVVNDRYVQLNPAYSGGPRMRTAPSYPCHARPRPISVDAIIDSLDDSVESARPERGEQAHGALSAFVASAAHAFGAERCCAPLDLDLARERP